MKNAKSLVSLIVLATAFFPVLAAAAADAGGATPANPKPAPSLEYKVFELRYIEPADASLVLRAICEARRVWSVTGARWIVVADTRENLQVMSELLKHVDASPALPAASMPRLDTKLPAGPIPDTDPRRIDTFAPAGDLEFEAIGLRNLDLKSAQILVTAVFEARRVVILPAQHKIVLADSRERLTLMVDLLKRLDSAAASSATDPAPEHS
jgi:hypothetical protein